MASTGYNYINNLTPDYWVVNTVRYQLKKAENEPDNKPNMTKDETDTTPINFSWKEIIRIMKTQIANRQ